MSILTYLAYCSGSCLHLFSRYRDLKFWARHTLGVRESLPFGQLSRRRQEYTCKNFKSFYDNEENKLQPPAKLFLTTFYIFSNEIVIFSPFIFAISSWE